MKFPWYIWIPRILLILLAIFMALFSLDVFEGDASAWNKLLGLLIHNIPSFVLLLGLLFTWKRPFWGGVFFVVLAIGWMLFYIFRMKSLNRLGTLMDTILTFMIFVLPMLISAALFFLAHLKKLLDNNPDQAEKTLTDYTLNNHFVLKPVSYLSS
jgi:hypothetical protein